MKNLHLLFILKIALLLTFVACGSDDDDDHSSPSLPQNEQSQDGTFRGVLNAVNPDVTSSNAAVQMINQNDRFSVDIFGSGPATTHAQFLHAGTRCPTSADDTNGDGLIDATEGAAVFGARIIALDSDLETNGGVFPFATQYHYVQEASFTRMLQNANLAGLNLEDKVITIQGVPEATELPETVQGSKQDFPIACGTMIKVSE